MSEHIELTHTGEILREEFIEPYGMSQNALAKAIDVPANRIHQIVKGTRSITADTDLRLCKFFKMSDGFFLNLQADYEMRIARRKIATDLQKIKPYTPANDSKAIKNAIAI